MLSKTEAMQLARAECERRALPFTYPVKVSRGFRHWRVWTKADSIGGNVDITINPRRRTVTDVWVNPK